MAKKTLLITLFLSEIIYDVQNKTYLTGRSRKTGSNHEEVANMQANDDDENLNEVLRSIGDAFSELKTKLSEYISDEGTTANNVLLSSSASLAITLTMPSNYNEATRDTISSALHDYITNASIAEWFTITNKADAADYVTKAANNLETIREAINKRVRPTRTAVVVSGGEVTE